MKKRANLSFTILIALLVVCCGAALMAVAGSSKYNSKSEYERIEARYIAESGVDTSAGFLPPAVCGYTLPTGTSHSHIPKTREAGIAL